MLASGTPVNDFWAMPSLSRVDSVKGECQFYQDTGIPKVKVTKHEVP
jgi:hypothetical protein